MTGTDKKRAYERAGRRAEFLAALYLRLRGHSILAKRFKCKAGEIDLVAKRGKRIIFVEVKQRQSLAAVQESISYRNEQRVMAAAEVFMTKNQALFGHDLRFDAIYLVGRWKLSHMKDAFRAY